MKINSAFIFDKYINHLSKDDIVLNLRLLRMNEIYKFFGLPEINDDIINLTSQLSPTLHDASYEICSMYYINYILNKLMNENNEPSKNIYDVQFSYGDLISLSQTCSEIFGIIIIRDINRILNRDSEFSFNSFICDISPTYLIDQEKN